MPRAYTGACARFPLRSILPCSALLTVLATGGCAIDIPLPGFSTAKETTASIDPDAARLLPAMTGEDWLFARAALKKAMETAPAAGETVPPAAWGNPNSGLHGTFARDPDPKAQWLAAGGPKDGASCQFFIASIVGTAEPAAREGLACRDKAGLWSIRDVRDRAPI